MGEDYNAIDETIFFPVGTEPGGPNDQQCFTVFAGAASTDIINDFVVESGESVTLQASSVSQTAVFTAAGGIQATLQIIDDDGKTSHYLTHSAYMYSYYNNYD